MEDLLRRLRGVIGMGLTWAAGWIPIGVLLGVLLWILGVEPRGLLGALWTGASVFGLMGFFGGSIFSAVLRLAEGRRRFDQLSLPRFAAWGALGGLLLGAMMTGGLGGAGIQAIDAVVVGVTTVLGGGSAAGTLALARAADDEDLLKASADVAQVGLTEKETSRLLGGDD